MAVGDKILSINGRLLAGSITTREAGDCLRQAHGIIHLVIARPLKSSRPNTAPSISSDGHSAAGRKERRKRSRPAETGKRRRERHHRRGEPHHKKPSKLHGAPFNQCGVQIPESDSNKSSLQTVISSTARPAAGNPNERALDGPNAAVNGELPYNTQCHSIGTNLRRRVSDVIIEEEVAELLPSTNSGVTVFEEETGGEREMVLNTEWTEVEIIELENEGRGLGFGIVGGRSTGVVVKTILHQGAAKKVIADQSAIQLCVLEIHMNLFTLWVVQDGRLSIGDHIIQINDVHLTGMASEQVATILRQCPHHVRLIVARAHDDNTPAVEGYNPQLGGCWVIRTE